MAAMLGSLAATSLLALSGHFPEAPMMDGLSAICKIAIGVMMGRRINRETASLLRKMLVPATLVSVWMLGLSVISGYLMALLSGVELHIALIGSAAGGLSEMAIFALSMNYDAATVTIIGVGRLAAVMASIPWLAEKFSGKRTWKRLADDGGGPAETSATAPKKQLSMSRGETLLLAAFSVAGGALLDKLGTPAGLMLGALVASGTAAILLDKTFSFHPYIMTAAQIGIGLTIGSQFGQNQIMYLTSPRFVASLAVCSSFMILATLLLAFVMRKLTGFSFLTCLLSTSAGGLSQVVLMAEEMDVDPLVVGILHLARYFSIVACMPFLITWIVE
jgi:membrane AbrB-like protein